MEGEILFLSHRIPFPPNRGDKIRAHHIVRALARMAPVHIGCFADDAADLAEEGALAALAQSHCLLRRAKPLILAGLEALGQGKPVCLTAFYNARMEAYARALLATGRIGAIYVYSGQMGQYVPDGFAGRVVLDFVDADSVKYEAYAARQHGPMGWVHAREGRLLRAEESRLAARADISLLVSEKEAELFRSRLAPGAAGARVVALGNGIDSRFFDAQLVEPEPRIAQAGAPRLIFTGQMDYLPNIAAVERVVKTILPLVRETLPQASFQIVGRAPTEAVKALGAIAGVHVTGSVDDVRPWLKGADIALCPLDIARGVQNKVLEAMAMGLPVVLTSAAATGISATPGQHFAVSDSDAGLAAAIIELSGNPHGAALMGREARRLVVENQSWPAMLEPLAGIMAPTPPVR